MKVLIDECAPKAMKVALAASGFDCTTVQEAGWSGKENGERLAPGRCKLRCGGGRLTGVCVISTGAGSRY
jgi:hypothetical protein